MLYQILNDKFSNEELQVVADELGLDWENLEGGTRKMKAMALQGQMERNGRTHELLAAMDHMGKALDLKPYLYLVIMDFFHDESQLVRLLQKFGFQPRNFGEPEKFPWGSESWRKQKAKALQKKLEEEGRIGELLAAIQAEARTRLQVQQDVVDFTFYGEVPDPVGSTTKEIDEVSTPDAEEEVAPEALEAADEYHNFDLNIINIAGVFRVAAEGQEGEDHFDHLTFDLHDPELNELIAYVRGLVARPADVAHLGEILRRFLFPENIWRLYHRCLKKSEEAAGLRIRLRFDLENADLIRLPWEYCQDNRDFFALNTGTPVIRYLKTDMAPKPIATPSPVRVLIAMASPAGYDTLSVEAEAQRIQEALARLGAAGQPQVKVKLLPQATLRDLDREIASRGGFQPHILHFIGHGGLLDGVGTLLLEDGSPQRVALPADAKMLLRLLRDRRSQVRVVVLNACLTAAYGSDQAIMGLAPRLVWGGIPAVIAMQFPVPDKTAVIFAEDMYRELAAGAPLDEAITRARRAASFVDDVFWGIPVLFMRSPNGRIWQ